ncbi:MAG: diaminopimelate epimerase [Methanomassiliicoccales archaeon]|nr:diaminopimelate epimerase [Methanomassiliicoccales archaeon]
MRFWKYHGLGNDFVLVEDPYGKVSKDPDFVRLVCDRHLGVGADGLLYVGGDKENDGTMRIINSDGSEAEMCGNGIRCVAKHLYDFNLVRKRKMTIGTLAGPKNVACAIKKGQVQQVSVDMGAPSLDCGNIPMSCKDRFVAKDIDAGGTKVNGTAVSMGNPHFVTFSRFTEEEMDRLGPEIGGLKLFPKGTNVEFAQMRGGKFQVKVFERGAGWTMACGTGACATAVAAVVNGLAKEGEDIEVLLPGGSLWINVSAGLSTVTMRGPAVRVFRGQLEES